MAKALLFKSNGPIRIGTYRSRRLHKTAFDIDAEARSRHHRGFRCVQCGQIIVSGNAASRCKSALGHISAAQQALSSTGHLWRKKIRETSLATPRSEEQRLRDGFALIEEGNRDD